MQSQTALVINDAEAEIVRHLFRWLVEEQLSIYQIVLRLSALKYRPRRGKLERKATVSVSGHA